MAEKFEPQVVLERLKRMQGKSCFNFKAVEDEALQKLEALTDQGFERFREEQLL